jgi:hypothetical protein
MNVGMNIISERGMHYFPKAKWEHLTELSLDFNYIGDKGCKYLAQSNLNKLKVLSLSKYTLN